MTWLDEFNLVKNTKGALTRGGFHEPFGSRTDIPLGWIFPYPRGEEAIARHKRWVRDNRVALTFYAMDRLEEGIGSGDVYYLDSLEMYSKDDGRVDPCIRFWLPHLILTGYELRNDDFVKAVKNSDLELVRHYLDHDAGFTLINSSDYTEETDGVRLLKGYLMSRMDDVNWKLLEQLPGTAFSAIEY